MMAEVQRRPGRSLPPPPPLARSITHTEIPQTARKLPSHFEISPVSNLGHRYEIAPPCLLSMTLKKSKNTASTLEIVSLYNRFCQLDRNGKGFISGDEFMSVPEFAVNPLSQRLLRMVDGLNFKEFVAFLSAFSSRANLQQKVDFIFKCYDYDNNGKVSFNEILDMLRDLTGQFIFEEKIEEVLAQVLEEAGYTRDSLLVPADFVKILDTSSLKMEVEVPVD